MGTARLHERDPEFEKPVEHRAAVEIAENKWVSEKNAWQTMFRLELA
jgi:hypothetical protein